VVIDARNPELEAQILDDPEDPAPYLVYADWLQTAGDPRGKLIAAQAAREADPDSEELADAEAAILEEHREALLGPEIEAEGIAFDWYYGFWRGIHIGSFGWSEAPAQDEHVARLAAAPSARFARRVQCSGPLTPAVLGSLAPLARTLREIDVSLQSHGTFADEDLLALAPLAELRRLALFSCEPITAEGLAVLASLRHLEAIDLRNCPLTDAGARCLAGLPLAEVKFNAVAPELTEAGMRVLAAAPLRKLHLDGDLLGDAHVAPLAAHPTLADLELGGAPLTVSGARTLASLPLSRLYLPSSTLDDRGVAELAPLGDRLRTLYLGHSAAITDAACQALAVFGGLVFLDLRSTKVTGAGLRSIARLHRLEHLDLGFLGLDDDAVHALAPLANLRSLSLCLSRAITDGAIDTLARLPALERLDLSGAQLTAHAIERLAELPHLQALGLMDCDHDVIERARARDDWYVSTRDPLDILDDELA
jgi:uncharacterized protein (TIGR02996 family)